MGNQVLSNEDWSVLRGLSIKGVPDSTLAEQFNVRVGTVIQRRRNDHEWLALWRAGTKRTGRPNKLIETVDTTKVDIVSTSLEELANENPLLVASYAHSKIKEAVQTDSLPTPSSWGELKTASEIFRKAVGLDRDQAPVQINLWSTNQDGLALGPTIDVTPPEPEGWV